MMFLGHETYESVKKVPVKDQIEHYKQFGYFLEEIFSSFKITKKPKDSKDHPLTFDVPKTEEELPDWWGD